MRRPQGGSMGLQATGRWGDWGVRRALTAFTILEASAAVSEKNRLSLSLTKYEPKSFPSMTLLLSS